MKRNCMADLEFFFKILFIIIFYEMLITDCINNVEQSKKEEI